MPSVRCQDLQELVIDVLFRGDLSGLPDAFYLGLGTGALPQPETTLDQIVEVAGVGYERQQLLPGDTDFPVKTIVNGSWKIAAATIRFENDGNTDWPAADYAFLTDVAAGTVGRLFTAVTIAPFGLMPGGTVDSTVEYLESR